jgi:phage terminase large subunit-like protein
VLGRLLIPYTCGRIEPFKDNRHQELIKMNEIVSINDWETVNQMPNYLLLITKESCEDCREVEEYLEINSNKIKEYNIKKINLDNMESKKLIESLEWIKIEVDFVPFWSLIIDSKRIKSVRGNIEQVKEIL